MKQIRGFFQQEQAQDLIEYTLILAFMALASAGLFAGTGGGTARIWGSANQALTGSVCQPDETQDGISNSGQPMCFRNGELIGPVFVNGHWVQP